MISFLFVQNVFHLWPPFFTRLSTLSALLRPFDGEGENIETVHSLWVVATRNLRKYVRSSISYKVPS